MDGRLRIWLAGGLLAATLPAVGCNLFDRNAQGPGGAAVVPAGDNPIQQAGWRQQKPPATFRPTETPTGPTQPRKKGQAFKPETDVAIADVELEAAFDESRSGSDRDRIIDAARMRLQDALRKDPKNKDALLNLAKLYTWADDKQRAVETYQTALQYHPKDKDVAFALMRSYAKFKDWAAACKACEMAIALDPENRTYRKSYGTVLALAERWDESFEALLGVMNESEARTFLGRLLIDTGRVPQGQEQLQTALAKDPQNETARRILAELTEYQQTQQTGGVR